MSRDRSRTSDRSHTGATGAAQVCSEPIPGKQTLTQQLAGPVQRRTTARTTADGPDVHAAAAHGTSGPATALPYLEQIQRSFGRHDVGRIQAHVDGAAAGGAVAMGAEAFAVGEHVAFAGAPDLHTAAHEAAHVVQQRGGVQLKGGVGEVGDAYERHADAVADLVVRGESSEALLDRHAGQHAGLAGRSAGPNSGQPARSAATSGAVQRHVFVGDKQIKKSDPMATAITAIAAMVTDAQIRSYTSRDELLQHAFGQTDYLGNLADGTWVRFAKTGLNILGEIHTEVSLREVTNAVGTTNFIDERLSNDNLAAGSKLKAAYETENTATFKEFGIDGEPDKQKFGAESLFPKMGYVLTALLPYLESSNPDKMDKLTREGDADERKVRKDGTKLGGYDGQPAQRYLKMAWAYARDVKTQVSVMQAVNRPQSPVLTRLADVVKLVEPDVDDFITNLPVDGFLGDALEKPENAQRWLPLAIFARAFVHAMVERAVNDPSSRLDDAQKAKLARGAGDKDNQEMFLKWRNFQFDDSVKEAAQRGVRYAGMGANHLTHVRDHLPPNSQPFDMSGEDLQRFKDETRRLRKLTRP